MTRLTPVSQIISRQRFVVFFLVCMLLFSGKLLAQVPRITSILPTSAAFGATVTITGTSFNTTPGNNIVYFGGVRAVVTAATATTVTVTVPAGARYAPVSVLNTVTGFAGYSSQFFLPVFYPSKTTIATTDFTAQATVAGGPNVLTGLVTGDLDNDGKPELVYVDQMARHLYIRPNTSAAGTITMGTVIDIDLSGLSATSLRFASIGDLDNDGLPDIVVNNASGIGSSIIVLRNTGTLSGFTAAAASHFSTDANPIGITLADLDGDGRLDMINANASAGVITVHQNNSSGPGNISFAAKSSRSIGAMGNMVSSADLNNDGKPEIFVGADNNTLIILPNTSSGSTISFGTAVTSALPTSAFGISAGDLDGDGKTDIAIANAGSNTLSVFQNTSSGATVSISARLDIATTRPCVAVAIGDLNGDGKPDLLLSDYNTYGSAPTYRVSILNNTSAGSISFATAIHLAADNIPFVNAIVDLDGDGKPDIVSGHSTNHNISIYRNSGNIPPSISSFSPLNASPGQSITINGNFHTDPAKNRVSFGAVKGTVTASAGTSLTVTVPSGASYGPLQVLNTEGGLSCASVQFFTPVFSPNKPALIPADITRQSTIAGGTGSLIYSLATSDLNDDGKPDLIMTTGSIDDRVYFRTNTSTGSTVSFASATSIAVPGGLSRTDVQMAVGDLDGDTRPDLVVPGKNAAAFTILKNNGSMSFTSTIVNSGFTPTGSAIKDFDNDGKPDIAIAPNTGLRTFVYSNATIAPGAIALGSAITLTTSSNVQNVYTADLDGDGRQDLIAPYGTWTDIGFFRNTSSVGAISFASIQNVTVFSSGHSPDNVLISDLDGDNKPDLVITDGNLSAPFLAVLHNTSTVGSISFSVTTVSAPYAQSYASLGDINGDGRADLVFNLVTDFGGSTATQYRIGVMNNTSSGSSISFADPITVGSGSTQLPVGTNVVNDFNGDDRPDIIASHLNSGQISIYSGTPQFAPTISSIAPLTAAASGNVVISGTGFNSTMSNNIVAFGTVTGTVTAASTTSLTVKVPLNASYAPLSVLNTNNTLSALSKNRFMPAFTPNKAALAATDFIEQSVLSTTGQLYGMAAGDLTGDGKPEIAITNSTTNSLIILQNTSTIGGPVAFGSLTIFTPTANFDNPRNVSIADMDGNGWFDLVVPSFNLSAVGVFLNSGTGTVSTALTLTGSFVTGMGPNGVTTGDLDGDGKPEIVTSNSLGSSVSVFRNTSTNVNAVSFAAKQDYKVSTSDAVYNLALADMDNDGKLDIIAGRDINSQFGKVVLLRNTSTVGSISFTVTGEIAGPKAPWNFVPGDLNGDGLTDFVASAGGSSATEIFAYTKLSSGGSLTNLGTIQLNVTNTNIAIGLADLNGDGKPDLISGTRDAGPGYHTYIYPNTTSGTSTSFGTRIDLPATAVPWSTLATDLNSDGRPDIVMGNQLSSQSTITIFRNTLIAPPVTQASDITVTSLTGTTATFSWTNGSGSKRAVFIRADNTGAAAPVTGTEYTANTVFASGSQIGTTGWYCVYNGTGNIVSVTGFTPSASYRAMVTEFNDGGLTNTAQYNTNTATNNPVTLTARATVAAISRTTASSTINTNTADFRVTFNANMTGLAASNFGIGTTGITGASVTAVTGSGTVFTVTANTGSGNGTLGLNLVNTTGMVPDITNTLPYTGEIYTIDKTAPTLSPVTIVSGNSNTSRAKTGDVITLNFSSSKAINVPVVTLAGHTVAATTTGSNNWTVSYTMTGTDAEGTLAFNIAFSDVNGNAGTAVSATTNSSSVVFDRTVPVLSTVTIATNNSNTSLAKQGNTITLSFTANETINTPVVTIAGHTVTANNSSANNWTASYTMTGTDAEGAVPFSIAYADPAGNVGSTVTGTTNSSNIIYDITAPALSVVTIASSNSNTAKAKTGDVVTLGFSSNETIAPTVIVAGHTVTAVNTGGNNWIASYTMTGTDTDGTIAFSISYSDASGNNGTTATATTNSSSVVFDRTAPTLSAVTIVSNNTNTARAKTGNIITLNFTAAEIIQAPTVSIATHSVTAVNTSGNAWTATYTMTGGDAEGTVPFSIAFSDVADNAGVTISSTTNSSSVVFDRTVPTLSAVTIVSNNTNTTRAKTGNIVTLNFTAAEMISTPTVSIATHNVTAVNTGGNAWRATYTLASNDAEGAVPFSLVFSDITGNAGVTVSSTTNNSTVVFDRAAPTLSAVTIVSNNTNTAWAKTGNIVTLNFTAAEMISVPTVSIATHNVTAVNTGGSTWAATYIMTSGDAEGTVAFSVAFNDVVGNAGVTVSSTTNSSNVVFDRTAPTLSAVTIVSNNTSTARAKTGNTITLNFTAAEMISAPTVSIATHSVTAVNTSGNAWTATYTMTGGDAEGTVPFSVAFTDVAGNAGSAVSSTTNSSSVIFDKTAPILTSVTIGSDNTNPAWVKTGNIITVRFTADEAILVPVVSIAAHSIIPVNTTGNSWTAAYTVTAADTEGTIPFNISFADISGNEGTPVSATTNNSSVVFDKTAPALSPVTIVSGNSNTAYAKAGDLVTINFTGNEILVLPVVTIATHTVAPVNITGNVFAASYTMTATDAEGNIPFSIAFTDRAGNAGISVTGTTDNTKVMYDITKPVLSVVSIGSNNSISSVASPGNTVTISFIANEGILTPTVVLAGHTISASNTGTNTWSATYAMQLTDTEGTIVYSIMFTDIAGNTGTAVGASTNGTKVVFSVPPGPRFTGGAAQGLAVCTDAGLTSINSLMRVKDNSNGATLTWSVLTAPAHGSLSGFNTTAVTNGGIITPAGLGYQSFAGYSGADVFTVRVSDGTLSATTTVTVTVSALPSGSITSTGGTMLCTGSSFTLTANGGNTYQWFKDGLLVPGNNTPQLVITTPGIYTAILVNAAGCETPASNSITITQLQQPKADFTPDINNCINLSLQFTNTSVVANSGTVSYLWNDGKGLTSTAVSASFSYTQTGTYNVKLKVIPQACPALTDSITKTITIVQAVAGIRNPTIDVAKNQLTQLTVRGLPGATYQWSPSRFLVLPTVAGPTIFAAAEQEYLISQKVPGGCITVDTLLVRLHDNTTAYLPNVFTPNGDGQNDILMPNLVGVKQLRFFRIFNRWGKMLFETTNIGVGWNGKYNGVLQPLDTYTWSIEGYDGNGIFVKRQGSVTLVR